MILGRRPDVNFQAVLWMGVAVFAWSWEPLVVAVTGTRVGPFVFGFWYSFTVIVVWLLWLLVAHSATVMAAWFWVDVVRGLRSRDGLLAVMCSFDILVFVWATLFLDTAVVTVIVGGRLILFMVFMGKHDTRERYNVLTGQDWVLVSAAVVGVGFVALSQPGNLTVDGDGWELLVGFLLAVCSSVATSWVSYRFKLGTELCHKRLGRDISSVSGQKLETGCVVAVSVVATVPSVLVGLCLGLVFDLGESAAGMFTGFLVFDTVWVVLVASVAAAGGVAFRYANTITSDLGVNTVEYVRPVLSVLWLMLFAVVTVPRVDWLMVGAAVVLAANALIGFRPSCRSSGEVRATGSV